MKVGIKVAAGVEVLVIVGIGKFLAGKGDDRGVEEGLEVGGGLDAF
jgi:hypothetical protein